MNRLSKLLGFLIRRGSGDRGRRAASPAEIPILGWRDIVIRVWRSAKADNLNVLAAGIAFYAFLALLPLIASTTMIYGLVTEPADVIADVRRLIVVLPDAAQAPVARRAVEIIKGNGGGAWGLPLAVLLTIYAGARGARAVIAAVNLIYGESYEKHFARRWGPAVMIALGGALFMLVALAGIAAFGYVEELMPGRSAIQWFATRLLVWLTVTFLVAGGCALLYRYGPSRRHARWIWITPGALAATLLWLLASHAFGIFIANFARYDLTYGSLAAVAILQLWIYLSAFIVLLGAKLNAEIELQTSRDTTVGPSRPAGRREAASSDRIGAIPEIALGDDTPRASA